MKFLLGVWVIVVSIWYLVAYVGLAPMSRTLGFCLLSSIPIMMNDVAFYISKSKYVGAALVIGSILVFFAQILKIFG